MVNYGALDANHYETENHTEVRKQYGIPVDYKIVGQVSKISLLNFGLLIAVSILSYSFVIYLINKSILKDIKLIFIP